MLQTAKPVHPVTLLKFDSDCLVLKQESSHLPRRLSDTSSGAPTLSHRPRYRRPIVAQKHSRLFRHLLLIQYTVIGHGIFTSLRALIKLEIARLPAIWHTQHTTESILNAAHC